MERLGTEYVLEWPIGNEENRKTKPVSPMESAGCSGGIGPERKTQTNKCKLKTVKTEVNRKSEH